MKGSKSYVIIVLLLILTACGRYVQTSKPDDYTPPVIKSQPKMFYPIIAQESSYSGVTKVVVIISKEGKVRRTVLIKSSGHNILDKAVETYCKDLTFYPALSEGEPIESRIVWSINFNFTDSQKNTREYLSAIEALYARMQRANYNEKTELEEAILHQHSEFIKQMNDALNFNIVIEKVILPKLANQWKKDWNSWPLSFLLYEDFIERFPDYKGMQVVKNMMKNAVAFDIEYIQNQSSADTITQTQKSNIISKIKQFIQSKYPDLLLDKGEANASNRLIIGS